MVSKSGGEVLVEAIFVVVVVEAGANSAETMDSSSAAVVREFDSSLKLNLRRGVRLLDIEFPMLEVVDIFGKKPDSLSSEFVSKDVFVVNDIGL